MKSLLNDSVPIGVRQLFETAKNISLYSWFVYRFHQVSELVAFSSLERALRNRYYLENPAKTTEGQRPPTLNFLLQHAKRESWISNEGFPSLHERARHLAEHKKAIEQMQNHDFDSESSMAIDEPSDKEVQNALDEIDMVEAVTQYSHKIRNSLAHGSTTLHHHSISTRSQISEIINQVYP